MRLRSDRATRLAPAVWSLSARVLATASFAAVNILLARRMTTADFGTVAVIISVATMGSIVLAAGVNRALLRNVAAARATGRQDLVESDLWLGRRILAVSMPIGLVVTALGTYLLLHGKHATPQLALLSGFVGLGLGLVLVFSDLLRAFDEIRLANLTAGRNGGALALTLVGLFVLIASGRLTVSEAVSLNLAALAITVLASALVYRRTAPRPQRPPRDPVRHRALVIACAFFAGIQLTAFLSTQVDLWVGSVVLSPSDVGIYAAVLRLMNVVSVPLFAAQLVVVAKISALHAQGRTRELEGMIQRTAAMVTLPAVVLLLPCIFAREQVLILLFGPRYARGGDALAVLAVAQLINVATGLCGTLLAMTSHERLVLWVTGIGALISLVADVIGANAGGMNGLAVASALTTAAMFIALWLLAYNRTGMWTHARWAPRSETV